MISGIVHEVRYVNIPYRFGMLDLCLNWIQRIIYIYPPGTQCYGSSIDCPHY